MALVYNITQHCTSSLLFVTIVLPCEVVRIKTNNPTLSLECAGVMCGMWLAVDAGAARLTPPDHPSSFCIDLVFLFHCS